MALLTLRDVHKSFSDTPLLAGVSLRIEAGERIGLVGANGSGKTTLLKILAGRETPDAGERVARRDLSVGWLEQEPRLPPDETIRSVVRSGLADRDAVLAQLGAIHEQLAAPCSSPAEVERLLAEQARLDDRLATVGGWDVEHRVDAMTRRLSLPDPETRCAQLSGGEARRVALARLLLSEPELLLLDEPTNHLDAVTTDWLEDVLLQSRAALVLVTHDRYLLDRVAQSIVELEQGLLFTSQGGYGDYLVARAERLDKDQRTEVARRNLLRRETAWMQRGPPARSTKAKARIERFQALADAAPEQAGAELAFTIPSGPRLGTRGLVVRGLGKAFGSRTLFEGLELEVGPGQRLGILGPNGSGKSTFLELVKGELTPDAGSVVTGETVQFASIDQHRTDLDDEHTVLEEVAGHGGAVRVGTELRGVESFLDQFLFPGARKRTLVKHLSGGERNRVLLARLLTAGGNVLVLDEPTNDLDLPTLRALEEALVAFPGAVLVVSHDRWFLDRVATHLLYLDGAGGWSVDATDCSSFLERRARREAAAEPAEGKRTGRRPTTPGKRTGSASARAGDAAPGEPARRRLTNWEAAELAALPEQIEAVETELAALDERLADPALYTSASRDRETVQQAREDAARRAAALYARWEELERDAG